MQQLLSVWSALDMRKRMIVVAATLAMFAAILGLSRMAARPDMALLYAGLDAASAGEVIKSLEAGGAAYEVRGGAIFVDSARRDELRLTMAAEGLPANTTQGYEILDNLSGFGTTSQMFNAAYWRAKEGELARTIMANPLIRSARVHLGNPSPQGLRQRDAATASVTVSTSGTALPPVQARALKYLVASAVAGLTPENVSVIDAQRGLIVTGDEAPGGFASASDRAEELRRNIQRLLEARVGYGNAVVEVSIETVSESESIRERVIDPNSRVAISSETEETTGTSSDSREAGVSVASNLPTGDAAGGGGQSTSSDSQTRERVNYEVSETTREIVKTPGAIRRISVAALVDGIRSTDADGVETWAPRPEEEMAALRALIASAVGFDESRGDVITLESLEFQPAPADASMPTPGFAERLNLDYMSIAQMMVLAVVALILGLFVLRPILTSGRSQAQAEQLPAPVSADSSAGLAAGETGLPDLGALGAMPGDGAAELPELPPLTGEIDDGGGFQNMAVADFGFDDESDGGLPSLDTAASDPVERLRALIEERQSETVEILRGWMENAEETA